MRLRRDHRGLRGLGIVTGLGFLALGLFALVGDPALAGLPARSRALGLGLTLVVVGIVAVVGSLTVVDPHRIW
jgi:hypothetical protein